MKIYVTRHGQVGKDADYYNGDVSLPKREMLLSELGREQATCLGKHLNKLGFHGDIYASPYLRTMETAELIAKETGSKIVPTAWIHEIAFSNISEYQGYSVEQLKQKYTCIAEDAQMEYPWWPSKPETSGMVHQRVTAGIQELLKRKDTDEEILLVGHGASIDAANCYLGLEKECILWNCSLGMYDTKNPEKNYGIDVSFMPRELVSHNLLMAMDIGFDIAYKKLYPIEMPEKLREEKGLRLLHIGDTHSQTYPFYKQLIQMVKPDILIHTGDMVDEIKAGENDEAKREYVEKVQELLNIFKESGCKIYWTPGNHDLPEEIGRLAPFVNILEPNTVLELEGQKICVTHAREQIEADAGVFLYGDGFRGDSFEQELHSLADSSWYLNSCWSAHALVLPKKELYRFERPD